MNREERPRAEGIGEMAMESEMKRTMATSRAQGFNPTTVHWAARIGGSSMPSKIDSKQWRMSAFRDLEQQLELASRSVFLSLVGYIMYNLRF